MDRLLVTLEVPAAGLECDFLIPLSLTVQQLVALLREMIAGLGADMYFSSGEEVLCRRENSTVLPDDALLSNCGLQVGDHLVLL